MNRDAFPVIVSKVTVCAASILAVCPYCDFFWKDFGESALARQGWAGWARRKGWGHWFSVGDNRAQDRKIVNAFVLGRKGPLRISDSPDSTFDPTFTKTLTTSIPKSKPFNRGIYIVMTSGRHCRPSLLPLTAHRHPSCFRRGIRIATDRENVLSRSATSRRINGIDRPCYCPWLLSFASQTTHSQL